MTEELFDLRQGQRTFSLPQRVQFSGYLEIPWQIANIPRNIGGEFLPCSWRCWSESPCANNCLFSFILDFDCGINIDFWFGVLFVRCARWSPRRRFGNRCGSSVVMSHESWPTAVSETLSGNSPRTSCKNPKTKNQLPLYFLVCNLFRR